MPTSWSKESQTKAATTASTADTSFQLDSNESFLVKNSGSTNIFTVAESTGNTTIAGSLSVTGNLTVDGGSGLDIGDSDKLLLGDSDDLQLYHDGSNSYITNSTGALKLATESSGIAISIGHTTSETTINDNLTVTGTSALVGNVTITGDLTVSGGDLTLGSVNYLSDSGGTGTLKNIDALDATTEATIEAAMDTLANVSSIGGNVTIGGDLTVSGGNITNAITFDSAVTLSSTINGATLGVDSDSVLAQSTGTGTSNTIFGKNAGDSIQSGGNYNTLFGEDAGTAITTGDNNVIVGYDAGDSITTGLRDTFVGRDCGQSMTIGVQNVAMGYFALSSEVEGGQNVAIGDEALYSQNAGGSDGSTTSTYNVAVGSAAGKFLSTGLNNTFIGTHSGRGVDGTPLTGNNNTCLGHNSGYVLQGAAVRNVIIGSTAGDAQTTGVDNILMGYAAGGAITTGGYNCYVGSYTGDTDTTGKFNVAVGYSAFSNVTTNTSNASGLPQYNTAIGTYALQDMNLTDQTVGYGYNTAFGGQAGKELTTGVYNTLLGYAAGGAGIVTGNHNTCVGHLAGTDLTSGTYNVCVGTSSGSNITTGLNNVAIGVEALKTNVDGDNNTAVGYGALLTFEADSDGHGGNTAVGKDAGEFLSTGTGNTFIGNISGQGITGTKLDCDNNTCVGHSSGLLLQGAAAGNVIIGADAGKAQTTASNNVIIGYTAGEATTTGTSNVFVGKTSGQANTIGTNNTVLGFNAFNSGVEDGRNVAIGFNCLAYSNSAGSTGSVVNTYNTAVGSEAGLYVSTGTHNTFMGGHSGLGITGTKLTGDYNSCFGSMSGYELEGVAHSNTFLGYQAGSTTEAGVENTCIGKSCKAQDDTATNQIVIGNNLTGTKDNAVFIGNDTSHIENDFNSDATWNHSSDIRQKTDIKDDVLGLDFINNLKTRTYKHKSPSEFPKEWTAYDPDDKEPMGGDKVIHGFIAQEVKEALDNANVDTFQGWSEGIDGRQRVSFEAFVLPLIKAVQELSNEVNKLKGK